MIQIRLYTYYKTLIYCFLVLFVLSCKSTKVISDGSIDNRLSAKSVVKAHYQNNLNFKTLTGKVKIDYSDGEDEQSFSVSLRMERDKGIWLSAPLGIVKAYITPDRVSFYNKLDNEYFDGDFSYLSQLLGTDVDFSILQNMLVGQALFDLREEKYDLSIADETYRLTPRTAGTLFKTLFQIEPKNFKMAVQQIAQPLKKRLLEIKYQNYQSIGREAIPHEILILAIEENTENRILLEYRNMELNREVNFPYKIPKGFKEIVLE